MLQDYWYIACRCGDIKRKPVAITIFNTPMVIFRGPQGQASALEDRCLHRGAPLSRGRVRAGQLQCPYHGWRYDPQGKVCAVPAMAQDQDCASLGRLTRYHCLEQDGYVWVCLGEQPAQERPTRFAYLGEPGWVSFRMNTLFEAPVEACLENFLDCPHATQVHRFWFRAPTAKAVKALTRTLDDGAETAYFCEPRERSAVWSLLSSKQAQMRHTDRFIAPATSRVDYEFSDGRYYLITSSCTPVNEGLTRVHTVISFRYPRLGPLIRLIFEPLSRIIIKQDVAILKYQQENLKRFEQRDFTLIEQDVLIRPILAWRRALREGNAPPEAGVQTHVDMRL